MDFVLDDIFASHILDESSIYFRWSMYMQTTPKRTEITTRVEDILLGEMDNFIIKIKTFSLQQSTKAQEERTLIKTERNIYQGSHSEHFQTLIIFSMPNPQSLSFRRIAQGSGIKIHQCSRMYYER